MVKRALTLLTSILIALPLLMPFNIYGAGETQIVPTWSQSSQQSQWSSKFRVTNFCESSNNPQNYSCQLTITVNGDYYGYVYFDGYINNQIIWDYQTMFISGGKGTFYYTWYANGLQQINKVNIAGLSLVSPNDNIDLSQIISILTSINNYEQQIENSVDGIEGNQLTEITEIRNVVNELIKSNGYLETISNLRQYNFPIESYSFVNQFYQSGYDIVDNFDDGYYLYPLFNVPTSSVFQSNWSNGDAYYNHVLIMGISGNIYSYDSFLNYFSVDNLKLIKFNLLYRKEKPNGLNQMFTIFSIEYNIQNTSNGYYATFTSLGNWNIIPIYNEYYSNNNVNLSTDFALRYGLRNRLLDNLDLIANGTTASQSAAQSSDSANSQLQTDSNTLFQQEDSFKSDMNNAMQNVNTTFRLQDMGTKFVSSAQWVRSQYESLTNNTPFASLITFSLITGLALILLGKVYK